MKFQELQVKPTTIIVNLGRGRAASCRLLSPAENHAIRRALIEPEAPIMRTEDGTPMTDGRGGVLRDDGDAGFANTELQWMERFHAVILAVSIGFETSKGNTWDRSMLTDPADGRVNAHGSGEQTAFRDAEAKRRIFIREIITDFLGSEEHDGLFTSEEIQMAYGKCREVAMSELIAGSAEGNSGSDDEA